MAKEKEEKKPKGEQKFAAAAAAAAAAAIIEAMPDSVCITDFNAKIIGVNKAMENLFEVPREKLVTMHASVLTTEQDFSKTAVGAIQKLMQTGIPQQVELTGNLGKAKGRSFWMNMSLLKDEKGNPTAIISVTRDITELKRLQEEAAKTKEATILEAMIDGVAVIDMNGTVTRCNSAWVKMFGYKSIEEALEKSVTEIITERDIPRCLEGIKKCFETSIAINFEFIGKDKSGKEFPIILNAVVLKDERGEIIGIVGVLRDVTEIKKYQEELQEKIKELEDFHDVAVGRELKMAELEKEMESLKSKLA